MNKIRVRIVPGNRRLQNESWCTKHLNRKHQTTFLQEREHQDGETLVPVK